MTRGPARETMQDTRSSFSAGHRLLRAWWGLVWLLLFRPSPRPLHRWRAFLLRVHGADVHPTAHVYPRARVWFPPNLTLERHACIADDVDVYSVAPIRIGAYSVVSQYSFLCGATHDFEDTDHPLVPAPISIGRRCWIAADVFVAPGVTIGNGAVVGARSSVFGDLPGWSVAVGNPAKVSRPRGIGPADFGDAEDADADALSEDPVA
ncbi:MAG: LbetaH domain-containing protein [Planctomycetota bacterium]